MAKGRMTPRDLVLRMFEASAIPLGEDEYALVRLQPEHTEARREYTNLYGLLWLYLHRLSIPEAFPHEADHLLLKFDELLVSAYKHDPAAYDDVQQTFCLFRDLIQHNDSGYDFSSLACFLADRYVRGSGNTLARCALQYRLNEIYGDLVRIGRGIEILDGRDISASPTPDPERIKECVEGISSILRQYVEVHDQVFAPWWRSVPVPFMYRRMNFPLLYSRSKDILMQLEDWHEELGEWVGGSMEASEIPSSCLHLYTEALSQTVRLLIQITEGLALKAEGLPSFRWRDYRQLTKMYDESVRKYTAIGARLNTILYGRPSPLS